jgi:hypothetical protein
MSEIGAKIKTENERVENYFITLSEASKISGYTPEHLNLLCRRGVLQGKKFGRNWETTREWLNDFLFLAKARKKKIYKRRKTKELKKRILKDYQEEKIQGEQIIASPLSLKGDVVGHEDFQKDEPEKIIIQGKKSENIWLKVVLDFSLAVLISFLIFLSVAYFQYTRTQKYLAELNVPQDISEDTFLAEKNNGTVQGEETVKGDETQNVGAIATSENYKLKEINFGGVLLASANGENLPIEISDIKSEVFTSKDGKQAQVLVSWKTNKLAISEISYSKNGENNSKTAQEKFYGFNHSVVLAKLDLATTYVYQIKVKDHWGNEISSEKFGVYTGSKVVSVFDLILKAVDETFGWAMKK